MKVKELINLLQQEDPERLVVLSIDEEGNGFSPLHQIEPSMYHDGEIGLEKLTTELLLQGFSDEDVMTDGEKVVVLWP